MTNISFGASLDFLKSPLFSLKNQSQSLRITRAELLVQRAQLSLGVVAALMVAWIPVDYLFVDLVTFWPLAFSRFLLAALFVGLILFLSKPYTPITAYSLLGIMVLMPIVFSYVAIHFLSFAPARDVSDFLLDAYRNLPVLSVLLLAFFPLTIIESLAFGLAVLFLVFLACFDAPQFLYPALYINQVLLVLTALIVVSIANVSQLWFMSRFVHLSSHDQLTGCLRRDYGMAMLAQLFSLSRRNHMPMSLVFLDVDNFKQINDFFGHQSGDEALKTLGQNLNNILRQEDMAIRWGGEEFVLLLPNTDLNALQTVLTRIRAQGLGERPDSKPIQVSMGVSEMLTDGIQNVDSFIDKADKRVYQAKEAGRNTIVFPGDKAEVVFDLTN